GLPAHLRIDVPLPSESNGGSFPCAGEGPCLRLLVHPYRRPRRVRGLVEVSEGPRDLSLPIVRDLRFLMPVLREGIVDVGLDALRVEAVREFRVELIPQGGPFQVAGLQLG